jgi:hypothetical protein
MRSADGEVFGEVRRSGGSHSRGPAPRNKTLWWVISSSIVAVVVVVVAVVLLVHKPAKHPTQVVAPPVASSPAASAQPVGWPSAANTGVPPGTQLDPSGSIEITQNGATVSNLDITGQVDIDADNVTITDVKIVGTGMWGIIQRAGHHGLTITDSEISGDGVHRMQYAILDEGSGISVDKVNIHACDNCIQATVATITNSYLHDPVFFTGAHIDMIIDEGGTGPFLIRHNTVVNPLAQTSAIALFQDDAPVQNATIEDNKLGGGGYTIYGGGGTKGKSSHVVISGNRFLRTLGAKGGEFGVIAYFNATDPGNLWSNNVWDDTGLPAG